MKRILILASLVALSATLVFAQEEPVAVLEFFDDDRELQILDANDFDVNFFLGVGLSPGDQIITGATSAEIRLEPNGSIVRIDNNTRFTIEGIQGRNQATETTFGLTGGRARMVAARLTGRDSNYTIRTPTAVAGVRGTDFVLDVIPGQEPGADGTGGVEPSEQLTVLEGEVIFASEISGEQISVVGGQTANVFAPTFLPVQVPPQQLAQLDEALDFDSVEPSEVPGQEPEVEQSPEEAGESETAEEAEVAEEPSDSEGGLGDALFERLAEITGLQVGTVTLDGLTYSQVVFQPRVEIGRLALALYLPITYTQDLFDASEWYRPEGNNEWSFGTDQDWSDDPLEALADLGTDLALKVRSLEYAERGDPFFVKIGNLSNFTIGQGLLMNSYANDVDFPVVRNIGLNLGLDGNGIGFEAVIDDLADPEILGGRLYVRPIPNTSPAAIGISAITDIGPASNIATLADDGSALTQNELAQTGDPIFLNVATDVELPIIRSDALALISFAEVGGLIPILRNGVDGTAIGSGTADSGIRLNALFADNGELRNYGLIAGVRGNLAAVDYQLAFRRNDGLFEPNFYGPNYDRLRERFATGTVAYLLDEDNPDFDIVTQGIDGQAGITIFGALDLVAGYYWPWEIDSSGDWSLSSRDEFLFQVIANEGLIPLGIQAGFSYRRTFFASTIAGWGDQEDATLFDVNTVVDGFVAYPLTDFIDIVARVSTAVLRDDEGRIEYDADGDPRIGPTVSIQTQIGL